MMQIHETLEKAKAKLEEGFCTRNFAQDKDGNSVSPTSPRAVAWCARGAIRAVLGIDSCISISHGDEIPYEKILDRAIPDMHSFYNIARYNNQFGKAATLAVFDTAIKSQMATA